MRSRRGVTPTARSYRCRRAAGRRRAGAARAFVFFLGAAACFAWEFWSTRERDPQKCFAAFLHNHWAGLAILLGIVLDYALR